MDSSSSSLRFSYQIFLGNPKLFTYKTRKSFLAINLLSVRACFHKKFCENYCFSMVAAKLAARSGASSWRTKYCSQTPAGFQDMR